MSLLFPSVWPVVARYLSPTLLSGAVSRTSVSPVCALDTRHLILGIDNNHKMVTAHCGFFDTDTKKEVWNLLSRLLL